MSAQRTAATLWRMLVGFYLRLIGGGGQAVTGFVDAVVRQDTVVGWARDVTDIGRHLEIQILHGKDVAGYGIADQPRKDLMAAGVGDGCYGFRVRVSPQFLDGRARTMMVHAVTDQGKVPLQRGLITILGTLQSLPMGKARVHSRPAMVGALERISGNSLHGWAYNPEHPDMPTVLDIYDDERYLGSVTADRSRPRLYEKGFPSGARGFVFEVPDQGEGIAHERLRVRIAGTVHELERTRDFGAGAAETSAPALVAFPVLAENGAASAEGAGEPVARIPDAVALWLLGPDTGYAARTLAAWARQQNADVRLVASGGLSAADFPAHPPEHVIAGSEKTELVRQVALNARFVLFCPAGDTPDPICAATLLRLPGFADVMPCEDRVRSFLPGDALRLEAFLRPPHGPLAVRSDALLRYPGNLMAEAAQGNLAALRLWLAEQADLRWLPLPPQICDATAGAAPMPAELLHKAADATRWRTDPDGASSLLPALQPRRISIALWDGWEDAAALGALLSRMPEASLDILVPNDGGRGAERLARADAIAAGRANVRTRMIDCDAAPVAMCAALLAAADGDVVLLSDGSEAPPVASLLAWAMHPHAGAVGTGGMMLGGDLTLSGSGQNAQVVDGISLRLMAVMPQKAAAAGLPDAVRFEDVDHAGLEFSLRLRRFGFHCIVLPGRTEGDAVPQGPLPWSVAALLRTGGLLG